MFTSELGGRGRTLSREKVEQTQKHPVGCLQRCTCRMGPGLIFALFIVSTGSWDLKSNASICQEHGSCTSLFFYRFRYCLCAPHACCTLNTYSYLPPFNPLPAFLLHPPSRGQGIILLSNTNASDGSGDSATSSFSCMPRGGV